MKICSFLYCPAPASYPAAAAMLENLKRFPPKHDLVLYSEHDHGWPGQIKLKISPEVVKTFNGPAYNGKQDFRISNVCFLTGLQIIRNQGYTHAIALEADCRVGCKDWDDAIFSEYFSLGRPCITAGSLAFYNPANHSAKALSKWQAIVALNTARNFPCPTYGWVGAADKHPSCVFPNGALSVVDVTWMQRLFALENAVSEAVNMGPWDMVIGQKIWEMFAEDAYEVTGQIGCIFSGYGDIVTTESQRLEMLRTGRVVAIHQVKSAEQP